MTEQTLHTTTIRIPRAMHRKLVEIAARRKIPLSELVSEVVNWWLDQRKGATEPNPITR